LGVSPDGRPGLEEVSRFFFDIQDGAVRGQPGIDLDGHVGHESPAGGRGPGNHNLWFPFLNEVSQAGGVGLGQEMLKRGRFHGQDVVRPTLDQLLQVFRADSMAQNHCGQIRLSLIRQQAPPGQELMAHSLHPAGGLFG
jgi:hypothetical protein